ncbi:MAG TPA: FAD-binding oxidoreductase [Burkholderiaceae bacterium]|nr:FAD-binding oxidoreductase [Burkholderiaceae bacterium]
MDLIDGLRHVVGADHVLTAEADCAPYLTDWRRRYVGRAQAVVLPGDTAQVAAVVARCARDGVPIVPQGGNTGLVGGATPDASGRAVVVAMRRLDRIRAIDAANETITAEAGCVLRSVQAAALDRGLLFPLSLAAEGSCTIGGNLSTNAGGTQVLRYGNARELVLGLEVVLPDGRVWDGLRGLRKDNTGYDLKQLFIGAEGTLGLICAATLRLFPAPRAQVTAFAATASLERAATLLARLRASAGATLTAFEVMSASCLDLLRTEYPGLRQPFAGGAAAPAWSILVELSDPDSEAHAIGVLERALDAALAEGVVDDVAVAQSGADSASMWRLRETIPEAQTRAGGNVKHDISLPVSRIPEFVANTNARLLQEFAWLEPITFGHLGDGNLHYNIGVHDRSDLERLAANQERINRLVHDAVHAAGGSISAEHGLGQLKRDDIARYKSDIELQLMARIKHALDPDDIMNPGKVIPAR